MNIGFDGYETNVPLRVGIGRFAFEILLQIYAKDRKNSYTVFLPGSPLKDLPPECANFRYKVIPSVGLWTLIGLPLGLKRSNIDLFFSPTHYIPRFTHVSRIVSVMDLSYLHYPELFRRRDLYKLKNWSEYSIRNCVKIITISEFTKKEITKFYNVNPNKIVVAYPGIDLKRFNSDKRETSAGRIRMRKKFGIVNKYLLFVGTLQPRKNISRLLEAWDKLKRNGNNLQLVIVGNKGWLYQDIYSTLERLKSKDSVLILSGVSDADMPSIYQNAEAFCLPSLYEGFGIPVLEAMACGIPTVISDTSSLPEIGSDASIYINAQDVSSIAGGLEKILSLDSEEKNRIIKKGLENIKRFNWQDAGSKVLEVFKEFQRK